MNTTTSLYLDMIRPFAAFVVLLSHVSFDRLSGGQYAFAAIWGIQAVDIFFVLSGFVIAHVCHTRERGLKDYTISRATRIYSVAIPAILLTFVLDTIGRDMNPQLYDEGYQQLTVLSAIRSLLFLTDQWEGHRFPGTNGPYWSLGFEVWYYATFGVVFFLTSRWRWVLAALIMAFIGPKVLLMLPVWLMGVAAYHYCLRHTLPQPVGWVLLISPILLFIACQYVGFTTLEQFTIVTLDWPRLAVAGRDYVIGGLFTLHVIGFWTVSPSFAALLEAWKRPIRWLAGGTFSLYLAHLPIMIFLAAISPFPKHSPYTPLLLIGLTTLACYAFAELSERRKAMWRPVIAWGVGLIETLGKRGWRRR